MIPEPNDDRPEEAGRLRLPRSVARIRSSLAGRPPRQLLAAALFLGTLTTIVHGSALRGNWRADDGDHLGFALAHEPWEYFFVPEVNRAHHGATITPWNVLFYDVNLGLFGFEPSGHYLHMLLLVALAAWLLYAVLRKWLDGPASLVGASALVLAGPTVHIAQFLMVGHYATGLVLCLVATYGWIRFLRGGPAAWLAAGAAAYLLATLCKETCVPLVLFLPMLGEGSVRRRLAALVPFAGVALGYVLWRRAVLGVFVGGYSPTGEGFRVLESLRQLAEVPRLLLGGGPAGAVGVGLLLAAFLLAWRDGRIRWSSTAGLLVAALLPVVPLTILPGIRAADRFLFFPAAALAVGIAVLWPRRGDPPWRLVPALGVLVLLGVGHVRQAHSIRGELRRMDALYDFALRADPQTEGLFVESDHGYFREVLSEARAARDRYDGKPPGRGLVVLSDTAAALPALAGNEWSGRTYYRYANEAMRPMTATQLATAVAAQREALERGRLRELRVELKRESGILSWEFGPWNGEYQVNLPNGGLRLVRKGAFPWPDDERLDFIVCFEGERTWVACTPRLGLPPGQRTLAWARPGLQPEPQASPAAR
ncbi:MAG TPA: glycosyltransferase family 39 protein [Thermoanaerobaculia bacterium]|nr:glycosyltransferase family 39 protein [Thermoanaerobaculia bacterium]